LKHESLRWNPGTQEWYCARCGRSSGCVDEPEAQLQLEKYECSLPSVEGQSGAPGTETMRLIRKPYKMKLRTERSGVRFQAAQAENGDSAIQLELFHDTVSALKPYTLSFEVLRGTTTTQIKSLLELMNERIVGVIVTAKEK